MIEVNGLYKSFDKFKALNGVNMHVEKGNIYGLVGPNGAGKSTLIRHLTGVYRADAGEILVDRQPVYENREIKEKIGCIPDELFYFLQADTLEMKRFYKGIYKNFDEKLFEEFKGALTENFILNMLLFKFENKPNYYVFNRHEIDFIIQDKNEIIPIEVKSSENINNVSLTRFNESNENKISVRFSARNLDKSGKILNIPIFMAEYIDKLITLGME